MGKGPLPAKLGFALYTALAVDMGGEIVRQAEHVQTMLQGMVILGACSELLVVLFLCCVDGDAMCFTMALGARAAAKN